MVTTNESKKMGFKRGLAQLKVGEYPDVKIKLMEALGVNNRNSFAAYASGRQEMKVTQAEAVENVFNQHGVKTNIWGV